MEIVYVCPKCRGNLIDVYLTSNPPQHQKRCMSCGWVSDIENEKLFEEKDVIRIPYPTKEDHSKDVTTVNPVVTTQWIPDACKNCSNHPSNGSSGMCNCTLGLPTITCLEGSGSDYTVAVNFE